MNFEIACECGKSLVVAILILALMIGV